MSVDYGVKYATARERILANLKSMQWRSWRVLRRSGGVRYGARLRELKRLGYQIEDATSNDNEGKVYRLLSPTPGPPQAKMVKVYLPEKNVIVLLDNFELPAATRAMLLDALRSFQHNRHKL